jgi:DNA repair exonuclease SbcCD nuclease subunit
MSKVLLFSDLHVHAHKKSNDRLQDGINALEWVFKTAISREVKTVLFGGDLFHDRTKMDILTMFRIYEVFEKYFQSDPQFNLYLLLGNHDMWHRDKWDVHSPAFLRQFEGVHVVDKPCSIPIEGHFIDFLPYTENPIEDLTSLRNLVPRKKGEKRMLLSHLAVHGAKLNSFTEADVVVEHDGDMVKMDKEFLQGWDKVYLGHYHGEQILGDKGEIEYIGSTYELTKSEAYQEKHLILHDMDTFDQEYIVNNFSPRHIVLKPDQISKSQDLSKNFVTIVIPSTSSQAEIMEMRHTILNDHKVGSLVIQHSKNRKSKDEEQQQVQDARAILETQDKMLEQYITGCSDSQKTGLNLDLLMKIGMRIIETDSTNDESIAATREYITKDLGQ